MWTIEELKECGSRFAYNTRRGGLNWYVLEEYETADQYGGTEVSPEELFQLMKQFPIEVLLDTLAEEEMEAEAYEHGFDYVGEVLCQ